MPTLEQIPSVDQMSDIQLAQKIAFALDEAERSLGLPSSYGRSISLNTWLEQILLAAMENPLGIEPNTYSLAYTLSEISSKQQQANVDHEKLKQQPGGPLHQPKQEPTKQ